MERHRPAADPVELATADAASDLLFPIRKQTELECPQGLRQRAGARLGRWRLLSRSSTGSLGAVGPGRS
jgi:hypothetical protein